MTARNARAQRERDKPREPPCDSATCNCSLRIRLVGDGCPKCNPDYWQELTDNEMDEMERRCGKD